MNVKERQEEFKKFSGEQGVILLGKGHDYTAGRSEEDAYANFRIIADLLKGAPITSYTVTLIYFLKHVLSLITYAKKGRQESGEGLRGRHLDVANYAFILDQLKDEHVIQAFAPPNEGIFVNEGIFEGIRPENLHPSLWNVDSIEDGTANVRAPESLFP